MSKKGLALILAGILGLSACPVIPVFAQEAALPTFQEVSKNRYEATKEEFLDSLESMDLAATVSNKGSLDLTVTLEEMGKSLAAMFTQMDFSSLSSIGLEALAKIEDQVEYMDAAVKVNGQTIVDYFMKFDLETMDILNAFPQLSGVALSINYNEMMETASEGSGVDPEEMKKFMQSYVQLMGKIANGEIEAPDRAQLERFFAVFERYYDILLSYYESGETTLSTYTVYGISKDVTEVQGILDSAKAVPMAQEIMQTMKTDEDIAALFAYIEEVPDVGTVTVNGQEYELSYENFQALLDKGLESLAEQEAEEGNGVILSIAIDEDENVAAEEMYTYQDGTTQNLFSLYHLVDGDDHALQLLAADGMVSIGGLGKQVDGVLNGEYGVYYNDTQVATVTASGVSSDKASGTFDGTFAIAPYIPADPESESSEISGALAMVSGFDLSCTVHSDRKAFNGTLSVNMSGSPLVTIALNSDSNKEVPDIDESVFANAVSMTEEGGMETFLQSLDYNEIFTNLQAAGLSEEFLGQIMQMFS